MNPAAPQRLPDRRQVAERLHVSLRTVSRWAREGPLVHQRTLGGHRRYYPTQVDRLARELSVRAAQP